MNIQIETIKNRALVNLLKSLSSLNLISNDLFIFLVEETHPGTIEAETNHILDYLQKQLTSLRLDKQQASQIMVLGFRITNDYFGQDEYLHYNKGIRTEEGYLMDNFFDKDYLPEVSWQVKF